MIRKISIGVDYKNSMHYTVGQNFYHLTIDSIKFIEGEGYEIYVEDSEGNVILWKYVSVATPVVLEYDLEGF